MVFYFKIKLNLVGFEQVLFVPRGNTLAVKKLEKICYISSRK